MCVSSFSNVYLDEKLILVITMFWWLTFAIALEPETAKVAVVLDVFGSGNNVSGPAGRRSTFTQVGTGKNFPLYITSLHFKRFTVLQVVVIGKLQLVITIVTLCISKAVFLNSGPHDPLPCMFSMFPSSTTPD